MRLQRSAHHYIYPAGPAEEVCAVSKEVVPPEQRTRFLGNDGIVLVMTWGRAKHDMWSPTHQVKGLLKAHSVAHFEGIGETMVRL